MLVGINLMILAPRGIVLNLEIDRQTPSTDFARPSSLKSGLSIGPAIGSEDPEHRWCDTANHVIN
jgi:hypothetical protein